MKRKRIANCSQERLPLAGVERWNVENEREGLYKRTKIAILEWNRDLEIMWQTFPTYQESAPPQGPCWICRSRGTLHVQPPPFKYSGKIQKTRKTFYVYMCSQTGCRFEHAERVEYFHATVYHYVSVPSEWKNKQSLFIPRARGGAPSQIVITDGGLFLDSENELRLELLFREANKQLCKAIRWNELQRLNPTFEWLCPLSPSLQEKIFDFDANLHLLM